MSIKDYHKWLFLFEKVGGPVTVGIVGGPVIILSCVFELFNSPCFLWLYANLSFT